MESKAVTFVRVAHKKIMILVRVPGLTKDKWCFAEQQAYNYAQSNYKEGDPVTIEYEIDGGNNWQIKRVLGATGTTAPTTPPQAAPPAQTTPPPAVAPVVASRAEYNAEKCEIISENITTAVSQTLIALQGHVNVANVTELINTLHDTYCTNAIKNIRRLGGKG